MKSGFASMSMTVDTAIRIGFHSAEVYSFPTRDNQIILSAHTLPKVCD